MFKGPLNVICTDMGTYRSDRSGAGLCAETGLCSRAGRAKRQQRQAQENVHFPATRESDFKPNCR